MDAVRNDVCIVVIVVGTCIVNGCLWSTIVVVTNTVIGRVGENGSEEVAVFYAKKAVEETKETEKALKVLGLAIE